MLQVMGPERPAAAKRLGTAAGRRQPSAPQPGSGESPPGLEVCCSR